MRLRYLAAVLLLCCASACSKDQPLVPSMSNYSGNWSGLKPHSPAEVGTGVALTIDGTTITAATVVTEDYFGFVGLPGCLLAFSASGPATITGNSFLVPLSPGTMALDGISGLPLFTTGSFTAPSVLQGTFTSATTVTGQLNYTIGSATCGGSTYTGVPPIPGFGNQIRAFTATR